MMIIERPDWAKYFINIAEKVAQRATCPRAKVGAVIVKNHRIISTGYNGAPAGEPHCFDVGCDIVNDHCQRAIHAEVNAVAAAAKYGLIEPLNGAVLYYWDSLERPESCHNCILIMKAAGITEILDRSYTVMKL